MVTVEVYVMFCTQKKLMANITISTKKMCKMLLYFFN